MARLIIEVEVEGVNPALEDPIEIAAYLMDPNADDPAPTVVTAEWKEADGKG